MKTNHSSCEYPLSHSPLPTGAPLRLVGCSRLLTNTHSPFSRGLHLRTSSLLRLLLLLLVLTSMNMCSTALHAQFYNAGTYYVGPATVFYTNGSFTNTATATYQNDGTVYISGNISNAQTGMPAGAGTTYFNGSSSQTLSGTAPFRNLNIVLNNAAGLTLTNRLSIGDGASGTLTFTAGNILASGATQDVYFYPGATYTGYNATHQVVGPVTKSGTDNFDFPIGDGTHTADIAVSGLTAAADLQALYSGSGYGNYAHNAPIVNSGVFYKEWWNIAQTAGATSAQISLKWDDSRQSLNHTSPSTLVVANFSGGAWSSIGGSSADPAISTTGTVGPSNLTSTFGPFTFGSTLAPLPIILSSFTTTDQNCTADLSWTTSLEDNAGHFNVQQSTDNVHFQTVATLPATNSPSTYQTTVAQSSRQAYYRLQLVDKDGQSSYSPVDALTLSCLPAADQLTLFPNPRTAGSAVQARFTSTAARGQDELQVFDEEGRKVFSQIVTVNNGVNTYTLELGNLSKGVYNVVLKGAGMSSTFLQP